MDYDDKNQGEDNAWGSSSSSARVAPPADDKQVLVTEEGLKKLQVELEELKGPRRKELAKKLKEAIEYGDISENSEYDAAKGEQAMIESRIGELEAMIAKAAIIKGDKSHQDIVQIGSTVTLQNITENDDPETYTIVGSTEADPLDHKISNESPIGSAILGRGKGDVAKVRVPAGLFEYKVLKVV